MTGSLQIKNNKYYMVLNTTEITGKRKPKWISTGLTAKGNKKRAEQLLRETLREHEQRHSSEKAQMRFSDWIREWLESVQKQVDIITYEGYLGVTQRHILPHFDATGITLGDITRPMLQAFIDAKSAQGRLDGSEHVFPFGHCAEKIYCGIHCWELLNGRVRNGVRNSGYLPLREGMKKASIPYGSRL